MMVLGAGCCCFWVLGAGVLGAAVSGYWVLVVLVLGARVLGVLGAGGTGCCWVLGAGIWGSDSGKDCRFKDTLVTTWNSGNSVESCSSCYIACKEGMRFAGCGTESNYGHGQTQNRAFVARFWVCHMKWSCRVVTGGSGCGLVSQRWRVGHAFANARPGSGFGPKTRNQAIVARFRACLVKRRCGGVVGGGGDPQPHDLDRSGGE